MNALEIVKDLEEEEKLIIYALGAFKSRPLKSKIKLQKLIFLISNVFKEYKQLFEFEPHLFGPYSETLDAILDNLVKLGLIKKEKSEFSLTKKGLEVYKILKPKKELIQVIEDFKEFLHDLSDEEILTFIYVSYPQYISESAKWDELKKKRLKIAISLLQKGKISFNKAAEISGLNVEKFGEFLEKKKIRWRSP